MKHGTLAYNQEKSSDYILYFIFLVSIVISFWLNHNKMSQNGAKMPNIHFAP